LYHIDGASKRQIGKVFMKSDIETLMPKHVLLRSKLGSMILDGTWPSGQKLPSEKQISTKYGVSRTTVIRALRDMERDGLVLRRQGSGTFVRSDKSVGTPIGVMIPGLVANDIFLSVQRHIHRQSDTLGWQILAGDVLLPGEEDAAGHVPIHAAKKLVESGIKGVILVPHHVHDRVDECNDANQAMLSVFERANVPVVLLDRDICEAPHRSLYDLVSLDNRRAGFDLGQHLIERGRRSFIYLGDPHVYPSSAARLDGVRKSLALLEQTLPDARVFGVTSETIGSLTKIVQEGRIDAIICNSDHDAAFVMRKLLSDGVRIPDDIALVGFDDQPIARLLTVPLTTIAQPLKGLAIRVVSALRDRISHPDLPPTTFRLKGELVVRESS